LLSNVLVLQGFKDSLLSPLISILPPDGANVTGDIWLEFPIVDEYAQNSTAECERILSRSTIVSYSMDNQRSNVTSAQAEAGRCVKSARIGKYACGCRMAVRHFTAFAVAMVDGSQPAAAPASNTAAPASNTASEGLGLGAIVGIAVGALVFILVVGGVVALKTGQKRARHRRSTKAGTGINDVNL
jgi:hypothetical protein